MPGSAEPLRTPGVPEPKPIVPPPARPRSRWWIPLLGVIAAGALGWWALAAKKTTPPGGPQGPVVAVKTAPVRRGDLETRVRVNGTIGAGRYADVLGPRMSGNRGPRETVLLSLVASGTMVTKGQKVAEFDPQSLKDSLDDSLDTYRDRENEVAKKKVQQELDMQNLMQNLRVAKSNLDKAVLDRQALDIRTSLDQELIKLSVEEAQATYNELQKEVELTKTSQAADLRNTDINRRLQEITVQQARENITKMLITAPMDGMAVVLTQTRSAGDQVMYAVGDQVRPGTPFIKIVDPASMELMATINQAESSRFRINQPATIRLDAYPGAEYKGRLFAIGALGVAPGRAQYYLRTIPIRIAVENPDKRMIPDLSGSADILLEKEENTLIVPSSAIHYEGSKTYVTVQTPQGLVRRDVEVGLISGTQASIKSGLKEGENVVIN